MDYRNLDFKAYFYFDDNDLSRAKRVNQMIQELNQEDLDLEISPIFPADDQHRVTRIEVQFSYKDYPEFVIWYMLNHQGEWTGRIHPILPDSRQADLASLWIGDNPKD